MQVRTRIAPSPTGIAHIGTAYMALFNYAFAKQLGGEFFVRIEDTDRSRFVEGAEQVIFDSLDWFSIPYSFTYRQSERLHIYTKAVQQLIDTGHAYHCFCTSERLEAMRAAQQEKKQIPRYDRTCTHLSKEEVMQKIQSGEKFVIRMRMPDDEIVEWDDLIRGTVSINTKELDDQVLLKSDGFPTYHLAVVVDDNDSAITHIIRGEEWISSTPKHILLYRYFGWAQPHFAHMPLLRNPDKTKMSKRKNDVSIPSYKEKGFLPQALSNYLCLLGWSHPQGKDIFDRDEFIKEFSFERMIKGGPIFDIKKLEWMNGKYIREVLSGEELTKAIQPFLPSDYPADLLPKVLPLVRDRLVHLADIESLTAFFYRAFVLKKEDFLQKKTSESDAAQYLSAILQLLESVPIHTGNGKEVEQQFLALCDKQSWNRGVFFMTMRIALTGQTATPPLFDVVAVLGKDESLKRVGRAQALFA